jgi:phosphate transport system ATP-binding protein
LQAKRIADHLIFVCNGGMIEEGSKEKLFSNPEQLETQNYLKDEYCDC